MKIFLQLTIKILFDLKYLQEHYLLQHNSQHFI